MIRGVVFVLVNSLLTVLSVRWSRRLVASRDRLERAAAACVLFAATACATLVLLGSFGRMTPWAVLLTTALWAGIGWRWTRTVEEGGKEPPGWRGARLPLLRSMAAGGSLWWGVESVLHGVGFGFDDLTYHASNAGWWVRSGSISVPPLTFQSYYPMTAELVASWFVIPWHHDAQANLSGLLWAALLVTSGLRLMKALGASEAAALGVVGCWLVAPEMVRISRAFSANDLASVACGVAALTWALPTGRTVGERATGRALLCGLSAGLALGIRVTNAPLVAILGLLWGYELLRGRARARDVGAFVVSVTLLGGFWYLRNLLVTGNPLFPAALGPFPGPFDRASQVATSLAAVVRAGWSKPLFLLELAGRRLRWPLPLGVLALAGLVGGGWRAFGEGERERRLRRLVFAVGFLLLALYPFQPFSGAFNRPDLTLHHQLRFVLVPFVLGLCLLAARLPRDRRWPGWGLGGLAFGTLVVTSSAIDVAIAMACVALAAALGGGVDRRLRLVDLSSPAVAVLLWLPIAATTGYKVRVTNETLYAFGRGRPIGQLWSAVDRLPPGTRLGALSGDPPSHLLSYPLQGRSLQLVPVAIAPDGTPRPPLHLRWRESARDWWWEFGEVPSKVPAATLRARLTSQRIDAFLISRWPEEVEVADPTWPVDPEEIEEALGRERRLFDDGYSQLWWLAEEPAPALDPVVGESAP